MILRHARKWVVGLGVMMGMVLAFGAVPSDQADAIPAPPPETAAYEPITPPDLHTPPSGLPHKQLHAARWSAGWGDAWLSLWVSLNSSDKGSAVHLDEWSAAFNNSKAAWDNIPANLYLQTVSDQAYSNIRVFLDDDGCLSSSQVGSSWPTWCGNFSGGNVAEARCFNASNQSLGFGSSGQWIVKCAIIIKTTAAPFAADCDTLSNTSPDGISAPPRQFCKFYKQYNVAHEIGHTLSLAHEPTPSSTHNLFCPNKNSSGQYYPLSYMSIMDLDCGNLQQIYPMGTFPNGPTLFDVCGFEHAYFVSGQTQQSCP